MIEMPEGMRRISGFEATYSDVAELEAIVSVIAINTHRQGARLVMEPAGRKSAEDPLGQFGRVTFTWGD